MPCFAVVRFSAHEEYMDIVNMVLNFYVGILLVGPSIDDRFELAQPGSPKWPHQFFVTVCAC